MRIEPEIEMMPNPGTWISPSFSEIKMLVTTEPARRGGKMLGPRYRAQQQSAVALTTVRRRADSSYKKISKPVTAFECKLSLCQQAN
jgi:hypothetical protein